MLTRAHAIAEYRDGRIFPDRLKQSRHREYVGYADRMLALYRDGVGKTRGELHQGVRRILFEDPRCPPRRAEAFCKLLDEERFSVFDTDRARRAEKLRERVFRAAAGLHPLVAERDALFDHTEASAKEQIAALIGMTWSEIEAAMFSDVIELHRLTEFKGCLEPQELLSRYNVAQVQVALYRAARMTVRATQDFKTILRHAKLAHLLHRVRREGSGAYVIDFDGPASVLRETHRYGVQMARFLPALLACRGWTMRALIRTNRGGWKPRLELSPADGLRSHLQEPEEFDSSVEAAFAKRWGVGARAGWRLVREGEILDKGQHVFVPDFTLVHDDGRRVLLEIIGFWTPEYLQEKLKTVRRFSDQRILIAAKEIANVDWPSQTGPVARFKTALKVETVLGCLRDMC